MIFIIWALGLGRTANVFAPFTEPDIKVINKPQIGGSITLSVIRCNTAAITVPFTATQFWIRDDGLAIHQGPFSGERLPKCDLETAEIFELPLPDTITAGRWRVEGTTVPFDADGNPGIIVPYAYGPFEVAEP